MLYFDDKLTDKERAVRDEMIYIFNPVLKFILASSKPQEFKRYGYNSCRQTAIFATALMKELLPEYTFRTFEGQFIELIDGRPTPYIHAFTIATHGDRSLLIDISRVSKRLLFTPITSPALYPRTEDWSGVVFLTKEEFDLQKQLFTVEVEYFTNRQPMKVLHLIKALMADLKNKPEEERMRFCDKIYEQYTEIRR